MTAAANLRADVGGRILRIEQAIAAPRVTVWALYPTDVAAVAAEEAIDARRTLLRTGPGSRGTVSWVGLVGTQTRQQPDRATILTTAGQDPDDLALTVLRVVARFNTATQAARAAAQLQRMALLTDEDRT